MPNVCEHFLYASTVDVPDTQPANVHGIELFLSHSQQKHFLNDEIVCLRFQTNPFFCDVSSFTTTVLRHIARHAKRPTLISAVLDLAVGLPTVILTNRPSYTTMMCTRLTALFHRPSWLFSPYLVTVDQLLLLCTVLVDHIHCIYSPLT